jgi:hypothetical protein
VIATALGALVALDGTDSIDTGWWLAHGALVLGLGLVPWRRGRQPGAEDEPDSTLDELSDSPRLRL